MCRFYFYGIQASKSAATISFVLLLFLPFLFPFLIQFC